METIWRQLKDIYFDANVGYNASADMNIIQYGILLLTKQGYKFSKTKGESIAL